MADENVTVQRVKLLESDLPKMVVKGWLSPRTSFVVTIDGPFAAKEGAALLRLLGAQLDVLADGVNGMEAPAQTIQGYRVDATYFQKWVSIPLALRDRAIALYAHPAGVEEGDEVYHYSFRCYSCAKGWERTVPTSDCPRCGTTNNYCAKDAAGVRVGAEGRP